MQNVSNLQNVGHLHYASQDPDYVSRVLSRVLGPTRVTPLAQDRTLEDRSEYMFWPDFVLAKTATSTGMTLEPLSQSRIVCCYIPRAGLSTIEVLGETLTNQRNLIHIVSGRTLRRVVLSPGRRQLLFATTIDALEQRLSQSMERPVKLASDACLTIDADSPAGAALVNFASVVLASMRHVPQFDTQHIMMSRCRDAFIDLLCSAMGTAQLAEITSREGLLSLAYVRDAEDYMRQNCHRPIAVPDIAAHLAVSVRTLQLAFKRHREQSPLVTLTGYRLDGSRQDILAKPGMRLSEIGAAWGFLHQGRFTSAFRRKFGETPRDLRLRARRQGGLDG